MSGIDDLVAALRDRLLDPLRRAIPDVRDIENLRRLSGGASRESWAFDAVTPAGHESLILRRMPEGAEAAAPETSLAPDVEAELQIMAERAGVPVAPVRLILTQEDDLGAGYVMDRIGGETIARRILRDEVYAGIRPALAAQCGEILARIHAIPTGPLAAHLQEMPAAAELARYRDIHDGFGEPLPVFETAFKWLAARLPEEGALHVVHGDFRNGNFIVGEHGIRAVLDWELAHLGDPAEDLAWLCIPSWRFGEIDKPVGGFGTREDLLAAYEKAGGAPVEPERLRFWEVFGTLKWGIMCQMLSHAHLDGHVRSVERAAIGRRVSETEIDLLRYLRGDAPS